MHLLYIVTFLAIMFILLPTHIVLADNSSIPWKIIIKGDNLKTNSTTYWPPELQAREGDTITWINNDTVTHTITSGVTNHLNYTGKIFDSGIINPGETFSFQIPSKKWSAYYYFCKIHPWMTGKIDVGDAYLQQSPISTIHTDREAYHFNQIMKIFGSVNDTYQIMPITIQVFDSNRNPVFLNQTDLLNDHSFSYQIITNKDMFRSPGAYKIKAFYGFPATIVDTNFAISSESSSDNSMSYHISHWVRNDARWWSEGQITDVEFTNNIEYLTKLGYIKISNNIDAKTEPNGIPIWIKNDAKLWASGITSDQEFMPDIEYLINHNIARN